MLRVSRTISVDKDMMNGQHDDFEYWLIGMDEALETFLNSVPKGNARAFDFTIGSLPALEQLVLSSYPSTDALLQTDGSKFLDGAARYLGETVRRSAGGTWSIELANAQDAFFGLPQVRGFGNGKSALCPASLITACADRRSGVYLETVVSNVLRRAGSL